MKSETKVEKTSDGAPRENLGLCLLLNSSDIVPISTWNGGGIHSAEYRLVLTEKYDD